MIDRDASTQAAGNALVELVAQFAGAVVVAVLARPDVREAIRAMQEPTTPKPAKTKGLTKKELAEAIGKSASSIDRLDREGAPHTYAGDTKRYDLEAYRSWLAHRGSKRPAIARGRTTDVVAEAGLRAPAAE